MNEVPPKIVPFSFQDEQHILEGMLARASCVVSRGDLPLRIMWEKDRQPVPNTPILGTGITVRKFDEYSSILSIDSVKKEHSGTYTCVAGNDAGSARYSTQLIVNGKQFPLPCPNKKTQHLLSPQSNPSSLPKPIV
ncbi:hypothetical protein CHUAL_007380 [Chamberlinius hualienensis]